MTEEKWFGLETYDKRFVRNAYIKCLQLKNSAVLNWFLLPLFLILTLAFILPQLPIHPCFINFILFPFTFNPVYLLPELMRIIFPRIMNFKLQILKGCDVTALILCFYSWQVLWSFRLEEARIILGSNSAFCSWISECFFGDIEALWHWSNRFDRCQS